MKLFFSHRIDENNVGDFWSCPLHYYSEYLPYSEILEIKKIRGKQFNDETPLIIGGGGLIGEKKFDVILRAVANEDHRSKLKVLWGVGDNVSRDDENRDFLNYIYKYDLVGIRDFIPGHEDIWVPCASCKSLLFDKYRNTPPRNEIVYYQHLYIPFSQEIIKQRPGPLMTNNGKDLEGVLQFLSSGDCIITNSYHGAYWGLLLGKKVISTSWSSKFLNMKHSPVIADPSDWYEKIKTARSFDILEEYRKKNDDFFNKIKNRL